MVVYLRVFSLRSFWKIILQKKVALIEIGRGLGGRSSTRISKRFKGWKLNHGSPNFNISNSKNNLQLKSYIDELLENKYIKIDDSDIFFLNEDSNLAKIKKSEFSLGVNYLSLGSMSELSKKCLYALDNFFYFTSDLVSFYKNNNITPVIESDFSTSEKLDSVYSFFENEK